MSETERWLLTHEGAAHVVEIAPSGVGRRVTWTIDGAPVAAKTGHDDRVVLDGGAHGALAVRLRPLVGPARRVTWWSEEQSAGALASALVGLGGLDLDPEPGSAAARREDWIRAHPRRYAARRIGTRAAGLVAVAVAVWLLTQVVLPAIPWPDWRLPSIPWPSIPWPQIPWPSIPWPDWSPPAVPEWLRSVARSVQFVWPVLLAALLVRAELRRRRDQDERKRATADGRRDSGSEG